MKSINTGAVRSTSKNSGSPLKALRRGEDKGNNCANWTSSTPTLQQICIYRIFLRYCRVELLAFSD